MAPLAAPTCNPLAPAKIPSSIGPGRCLPAATRSSKRLLVSFRGAKAVQGRALCSTRTANMCFSCSTLPVHPASHNKPPHFTWPLDDLSVPSEYLVRFPHFDPLCPAPAIAPPATSRVCFTAGGTATVYRARDARQPAGSADVALKVSIGTVWQKAGARLGTGGALAASATVPGPVAVAGTPCPW